MFTGLIEEVGRIERIDRGDLWARLEVRAQKVLADLARGDSIAVNGVCLTVTAFGEHTFTAEVMAETLARTNLGKLATGSRVNLERALPLGGRLGGHLVSGHVDGVGTIAARQPRGPAVLLFVRAPAELWPYLVAKGSVAVDGVSLTIVACEGGRFRVSLIPHTLAVTNLGRRRPGDAVNLEVDILARYVRHLLESLTSRGAGDGGVTWERLREAGFL